MRSLVTNPHRKYQKSGNRRLWMDGQGDSCIREKGYKLRLGNYRRCGGATATIAIQGPMSDVAKSLNLFFCLDTDFGASFYSLAVTRHLSARCNSPLKFALGMQACPACNVPGMSLVHFVLDNCACGWKERSCR